MYNNNNNNYSNLYQQFRPQQQQTMFIKGRPVSSFDEVKATIIDFDGSIFYFPDVVNKKIYTKQMNMDGTVLFNVYELQTAPPVTTNGENFDSSMFVTRQEFENAINQLQQAFSNNGNNITTQF